MSSSPSSSSPQKSSRSLRVFRPFIKRLPDGTLDVSGVVGRECYLSWMRARHSVENDDEAQKFHRTLTNHVSGTDGRCPFDPEEEEAVLQLLRRKKSWPCFPRHLEHLGRRYRASGHHEKARAVGGEYHQYASAPNSPVHPHHYLQHFPQQQHHHQQQVPQAPATPLLMRHNSAPITTTSSAFFLFEPQESPRLVPPPLHTPRSSDSSFSSSSSSATFSSNDDVSNMLLKLNDADASYLTHLGGHVACNFAQEYSTQDRKAIDEILRFMIIGRTQRCCKDMMPQSPSSRAQQLCAEYSSQSEDTLVAVYDLAAKDQTDRMLAQNAVCGHVLGDLRGACGSDIIQRNDLYRAFVAMGGAYHRPQTEFTVTRQQVRRRRPSMEGGCFDDDQHAPTRYMDLTYVVDADSFLLVVFGKP